MQKISLNGKTIFVTGAAGFIGSNLVKRLLQDIEDVKIIGIDNMLCLPKTLFTKFLYTNVYTALCKYLCRLYINNESVF